MPPLLPQDSENILLKSSEPYYTNEDVAILHDIVVHAQELIPSLPERERLPTNALFHAYYNILPRIGIDTDHDSRYARILFKIGGTRSNGSLHEKFEAVLARMGIEIRFEQDVEGESGGGTAEKSFHKASEPPVHTKSTTEVAGLQRPRDRSSSETPALEPRCNDGYNSSQWRASSSASTAHSDNVVDRISNPRDLSYETPQLSTHNLLQTSSQRGGEGEEKNYGLRTWLNDGFGKQLGNSRTRSSSMNDSIRLKRSSPNATQLDRQTTSTSHLGLDDFVSVRADRQGIIDVGLLMRPKTFMPRSEDFMEDKVALMRKIQVENLAHQVILKWHGQTLQLRQDNINLETIARHHDQRVLLRQAFDSWHVLVRERRQIAEAERFFTHLERRAGRARDVFLMAKALTHWAYTASNEFQQTLAARRHILRVRYFCAWRDSTAVTELKISRQILRKFFSTWQRRRFVLSLNEEKAIVSFTDNLVQRVFWAWFWAFCERRAPIWRSNRLLVRVMARWAGETHARRNETNAAIDLDCQNVKRKILSVWSNKAHKHTMQICQANEHRASSSCREAVAIWRHESALSPRLQYLRRKLDSLAKYASVKLWIMRVKQVSTAKTVDRLKIMKEAWVAWNDKLRCRILQAKINDRLLLQGLYKWVLGERVVLLKRVTERRTMHAYVQAFDGILQRCAAREIRDLSLAKQTFVCRVTSSAIRNWRSRLQNHLKDQHIAEGFNTPLLLSKSLAKWTVQNRRIAQLQKWANNGKFYVLASKTINSWKNATGQAKRDKRRLAYTQFRRRCKIVLVRKILSSWHQQAISIAQSDRLAVNTSHNKSVLFCIEVFDRWRACIEEVGGLKVVWERSLLEKHLNELRLSLASRRGLEMKAIVFFEENVGVLCMRNWVRAHLQLRAMQHLVFELREKSLKRTCRRILRHWLQRSSRRERQAGTHYEQGHLHFLEETEPWVETGDEWTDGANDDTVSTSMLGYLSTPSRRMSRVKLPPRRSSTTPSAPLSTPVERHLRAQYLQGPLPSFRRRIGRSLLGREEAQLDLEDELRTRS